MAQGENPNVKPPEPTVGLDPIGQALRATYDAENHDSLGRDLTGLMLELARVEGSAPTPAPAPVVATPSWRQRLFGLLR